MRKLPTRDNPAKFTFRKEQQPPKVYDVAVDCTIWFFRLHTNPEAGWTAASTEFAAKIEKLRARYHARKKRAVPCGT